MTILDANMLDNILKCTEREGEGKGRLYWKWLLLLKVRKATSKMQSGHE